MDGRIVEWTKWAAERHCPHVGAGVCNDCFAMVLAAVQVDWLFLAQRLAGDALAVISGAGIPTPEAGYIDEPALLRGDLEKLVRNNTARALSEAREDLRIENERRKSAQGELAETKGELKKCLDHLTELRGLLHEREMELCDARAAKHAFADAATAERIARERLAANFKTAVAVVTALGGAS